jgi:ComF family protein
MKEILRYFNDLFALFFPELCAACGRNLFNSERMICTHCIYHLPHTDFHNDPQNRMAKQLWGRIPFIQACAFLYFRKGNKVQNLMHQLKYNKKPEAGKRAGELYGYELKQSDKFIYPELIIPVPLHPSRLKKRGYNQSECIAAGISSVLGIPVCSDNLSRIENTRTQTRKSRFARYENLKNAFLLKNPNLLINKHILLIDDVMTTGSTLEACSLKLLEIEGLKISVCTIAYAE